MPLIVRSSPTVRWFVRGHRDGILHLLSAVTHVGKKMSQGYGEVRAWSCEPMDEDWSLADAQRRVMRPIPKSMAEVRGWTGIPRWMPTMAAPLPRLTWVKSDFAGPIWISGIYKIVYYEKDSQNMGRPTYHAYHQRPGETMWGYCVDRDETYYSTLKAAQQACARHAARTLKAAS